MLSEIADNEDDLSDSEESIYSGLGDEEGTASDDSDDEESDDKLDSEDEDQISEVICLHDHFTQIGASGMGPVKVTCETNMCTCRWFFIGTNI